MCVSGERLVGLVSRPCSSGAFQQDRFSVWEGEGGGSWGGMEGGKPEGRRVRSGWLATCLDDISRFIFVFFAKGGGCPALWTCLRELKIRAEGCSLVNGGPGLKQHRSRTGRILPSGPFCQITPHPPGTLLLGRIWGRSFGLFWKHVRYLWHLAYIHRRPVVFGLSTM